MGSQSRYMIYGATGYTGRLIAQRAKTLGHSPVLAGRNRGAVEQLAGDLGFDFTVFDLRDRAAIERGLSHVDVVLHAAGPFVETAEPMIEACLATKKHYVDITGEIEVFETCAGYKSVAQEAGIILMPGAGFDVVPSDCLIKYVCNRVETPTHLSLALAGLVHVSRGTAKTVAQSLGRKTMIRRGGRIVELKKPHRRSFNFGKGEVDMISVSWGDVSTAYHSTGVPDVDVYFVATKPLKTLGKVPSFLGGVFRLGIVQSLIRSQIARMPPGPSAEQRDKGFAMMVAEVVDSGRNVFAARLVTPEPYKFTAETSLKIVEEILGGNFKPGFQTPSLVYGPDFILQFDGVIREDIEKG